MRAVDTNVLVRLLTRDDARQAAAADRFIDGGAWISQIVLVEATWVLDSVYELEPAQIATAVDMLLNHKDLTIESSDVAGAALERFRARPQLGFSDCLIVEVARKAGHLPLGTFDKDLGKLDGTQKL
jgi:predicted nucleic-acid-binding protein